MKGKILLYVLLCSCNLPKVLAYTELDRIREMGENERKQEIQKINNQYKQYLYDINNQRNEVLLIMLSTDKNTIDKMYQEFKVFNNIEDLFSKYSQLRQLLHNSIKILTKATTDFNSRINKLRHIMALHNKVNDIFIAMHEFDDEKDLYTESQTKLISQLSELTHQLNRRIKYFQSRFYEIDSIYYEKKQQALLNLDPNKYTISYVIENGIGEYDCKKYLNTIPLEIAQSIIYREVIKLDKTLSENPKMLQPENIKIIFNQFSKALQYWSDSKLRNMSMIFTQISLMISNSARDINDIYKYTIVNIKNGTYDNFQLYSFLKMLRDNKITGLKMLRDDKITSPLFYTYKIYILHSIIYGWTHSDKSIQDYLKSLNIDVVFKNYIQMLETKISCNNEKYAESLREKIDSLARTVNAQFIESNNENIMKMVQDNCLLKSFYILMKLVLSASQET